MIKTQLYGGSQDGKSVYLSMEQMPKEIIVPYINFDLILAIEASDDPTEPSFYQNVSYVLDEGKYKAKEPWR